MCVVDWGRGTSMTESELSILPIMGRRSSSPANG